MKLLSIPKDQYEEYRLNAIFDCYKWDPQFLDHNTLASYVLVLKESEYQELVQLTEKLDQETIQAEEFINQNLKYASKLALPKKVFHELKKMKNYDRNKHIRLMRYDFHPTQDQGWMISEVNSDVPGGFAEASLLPLLAIKTLHLNHSYYSIPFGEILAESLSKKVKKGPIMFVHCTSYSDDRQVMQYLGDFMESYGFQSLYGACDHVIFRNKEAYSILNGYETKLEGIFRFTPLEWVKDVKPKTWSGYFDTITPSCNHPIAIFAQTKRFPLIWSTLEKNGISLETWKKLLPETVEVKKIKKKEGYIYKPACGRVGEKISIKEACEEGEYHKILKEVKRHPKQFIAQKKFCSQPIESPDGKSFHVCIGSYTVDGKQAGFYARISETPRIDSNAADIPVIIERNQ